MTKHRSAEQKARDRLEDTRAAIARYMAAARANRDRGEIAWAQAQVAFARSCSDNARYQLRRIREQWPDEQATLF